MKFNFVSLTVENLEKAKNFYIELLGKEPVHSSERLVKFRYGEMQFSLYNPEADGSNNREVVYGNNSIPAFEVKDLESERERIGRIADVESGYELNDHRGFFVKDPSGNLIEIYEMTGI
ncbi:MAG: VOC family protein [Candidatus Nanohaloarchaea archaeon]